LDEKLAASKMAMMATWSKFIYDPNINCGNKLRIFDAAIRAIMLYASQVWGYENHYQVDLLFRYFFKKMLSLPDNTPNYVIYLESGLNPVYIFSLQLHRNYINKALNYPENRLPHRLAKEVIRRNTFWAESWTNLCVEVGIDTDSLSGLPMLQADSNVLTRLKEIERQKYLDSAKQSTLHDMYSRLNHDKNDLIYGNLSAKVSSLIIKARSGLLNINAKAFKNSTYGICTICNLDQSENTFHFVCICPIFKLIRLRYLGKTALTEEDLINQLNGSNYVNFYKYLQEALKYRNLIINEF